MDIPPLSGHINNWQIIAEMKRFYLGFPIAHAGGVQVMINVSAYNNATLVLLESGNLSGGVFEALIDYGKIGGTLIMPRPLIEISKSSSGLEKLSRLRGIIWSGDPEDWEFIHVNPEYNRFRFDHKSSNLHEIVAMPHTNVGLRHHQKIFWNYPHVSEWAFGDLFSPHPTKANLWKYEGRLDDMIIMDSGHNFHPMFYEQEILLRDQRVKGAVILGNGRSSLAVILEIVDIQKLEGLNAFKEFWPLIETVNQRSTSLAQIPLQNIIIASRDRPLPRGGKGTVLRKEAEKIYKIELDTIYSCASARA
ncbi:hypothetical protein PRZ48_011497 [Zasmidium cellare]|uniref:Uncharacterized protein n=1 Tax=Zasmidium cellare TaxID=395010 RepID=A0ABR0E716_ZASCE|nr:hypothetical protein PRZ48_011497 [Zasmidium cellare]